MIHKINNLPTLPTVLTKIIDLSEDRNANAADLGELLSRDPSISSMILKLVNSAYYGNLRHISSINHATVILGFQMVKTIAMGVLIYQSKSDGPQPAFDREQFWLHSLGVATIARTLASELPLPDDLKLDTIFLSGLLHDVGKVIFDSYFSEDYIRVAKLVADEQIWIRDAEQQIMHMDHTESGFYLARKWQFPAPVVEVIRFHHTLARSSEKNRLLCCIVHAADHCCREIGLGSGGDNQKVILDPIVEEFGLTPRLLEMVMSTIDRNRASLEAFIAE